jgi:hypothetical protein
MRQIAQDTFLRYLLPQVERFDTYLTETSKMTIKVRGIRQNLYLADEPLAVETDLGYVHRWHQSYCNHQLFQMFNLVWFYRLHPLQAPKYTMMITRTGTHDSPRRPGQGLKHLQYLSKFQEGSRLHRLMTKKLLPGVPYLAMLEPHPQSGYVHGHDIYFLDELPGEKVLDTLKHHWSDHLKMGSFERGMKVDIREPRDFNQIVSMVAYVLAYVGGTSIGNVQNWTKEDTIFNTCLWLAPQPIFKGGLGKMIRAFQPSHGLSKLMAKSQVPDTWTYTHIDTILSGSTDKILNQATNREDLLLAYEALGGDVM